jgi:ubiquinone/menaquinone biosynthesis C-methylase UbiE
MLSIELKRLFQTILWFIRRNDCDVVNYYNFLAPFFLRASGNNMLNFGYWTDYTQNPMEAQNELCRIVGKFADLDLAKNLADIGSGFSEPAMLWKSVHTSLNVTCVNINLLQQKVAAELTRLRNNNIVNSKINQQSLLSSSNTIEIISLVNATAKILPFRDKCMDRVIALESAHHFKPLMQFIQESRRILECDGQLIIAMPVVKLSKSCSLLTATIQEFMKLGILSLMWASEHYELKNIEYMIKKVGFDIIDVHWIGSHVYEPLANYYTYNRKAIKKIMLENESPALLSSYMLSISYELFEKIFYRSALKMKVAYQEGIIDYVLIKARLV